MNLKQYQKLCQKTAKNFSNSTEEIMTYGLGIAGEAGDVAGCIKKTFAHNDNQVQGIKENLGDTIWYLAMICNYFHWDLEDVLQENVQKLQTRYPQGFNEDLAKREGQRIDWNEK